MRMLRPSPGECADRQSILLLKCKYGALKHVDVKPFSDENNEIQSYLQKNFFYQLNEEKGAKFDELLKKLQEVNHSLWKIEDEVRIYVRKDDAREAIDGDQQERLSEIALTIPRLNDKRSDLVQEINAIFGLAGREKVYIAK